MAKRECVEHFVEGQSAWQLGFVGFLSRIRGLAVTAILTLTTMGVPWWWPGISSTQLSFDSRYLSAFLVLVIGLSVLSGLTYTRRRSLRSLEMKNLLHDLAHFIRDSYCTYCSLLQSGQLPSTDQDRHNFAVFVEGLCQRAEQYFTALTHDRSVAVAVRLAVPADDASKTVVYKTIARSRRLNQARGATSEPIPASEGLPAYLAMEKNSTGILIYNDIDQAERQHAFKKTRNEALYPREVVSLMVAPLNAWDGKTKRLIGLLYLTSRHRKAFSAKHVDAMRFMADTVANAVATIVEQQRHNLTSSSLEDLHGKTR